MIDLQDGHESVLYNLNLSTFDDYLRLYFSAILKNAMNFFLMGGNLESGCSVTFECASYLAAKSNGQCAR